jgi:hypothetical protein
MPRELRALIKLIYYLTTTTTTTNLNPTDFNPYLRKFFIKCTVFFLPQRDGMTMCFK